MFAMRACRKSVMIGKSLTKAQMTQVRCARPRSVRREHRADILPQLVRNMGTIDQPWVSRIPL